MTDPMPASSTRPGAKAAHRTPDPGGRLTDNEALLAADIVHLLERVGVLQFALGHVLLLIPQDETALYCQAKLHGPPDARGLRPGAPIPPFPEPWLDRMATNDRTFAQVAGSRANAIEWFGRALAPKW